MQGVKVEQPCFAHLQQLWEGGIKELAVCDWLLRGPMASYCAIALDDVFEAIAACHLFARMMPTLIIQFVSRA